MSMVYATGNLKQLCMNQLEEYYCKYTSCCITFVDPIYKIVIRIICWTTSIEESSFVNIKYIQIVCLEQRICLKMHQQKAFESESAFILIRKTERTILGRIC